MIDFETPRRHFRWPSLIIGILFILGGIGTLMHPGSAVKGIVWIIALLMLISGIVTLGVFFDIRRASGRTHWSSLVTGILDIILAIMVFSNMQGSFIFLGYLFAFWFLFDNITALQLSGLTLHSGFNTFMAVLGLIAGVVMLFTPVLGTLVAVYLLAFYLFLFGILLLARAF